MRSGIERKREVARIKFGVRDVRWTVVGKRTESVPGAEAEPERPCSSLASSASGYSAPEGVARSARQRLWAADVACYYAQRRFSQTGKAADLRIWEGCPAGGAECAGRGSGSRTGAGKVIRHSEGIVAKSASGEAWFSD